MNRYLSRFLLLACLASTVSFAFAGSQLPAPQNTQPCVEYFVQNGKLVCHTGMTQVLPDLKPALQALPIAPVLDGRAWRLNWWNQQPNQPMMEYGLPNEKVGAWTELITTQFFPGLQQKFTPQRFMELMMGEMIQQGFKPTINVISNKPTDLTYEFIVTGTPAENQHELQRIWTNDKGMYVMHYASRPAMSKEHRTQWIDLLNKAKGLRD